MRKKTELGTSTSKVRIITILAAFALVVAACSSDDSNDTTTPTTATTTTAVDAGAAGVAEAQSIVAQYKLAPEWNGPFESVDPSATAGKNIWYISFADAIPVLKFWSTNFAAVVEDVGGAQFTLFDANGDVTEAARGIQQAIADNADIIVTQALAPEFFATAFDDAAAAGIPVITGNSGTPGVADAGQWAEVTFDYPLVGQLIGDWFVADSNGEGKALVMSSDDVPASDDQWQATVAEVNRLCSDCDVKVEDVQIPQWETRLPTLAQSTITAEPDRNYMLPLYDGMTLPLIGGVRQAGAEADVKVGAFNATPSILPNVADPANPLWLDIGAVNLWWSYAAADAVFRNFDDQDAIENYNIGIRIFDKENIDQFDLEADEVDWYGGLQFQAEFEALWGES